jgi:predicted acetyltransferase
VIPEIRPVPEDELPAYVNAMTTAFFTRPDVARMTAELAPIWELDRTWAAFDDGRICGTFRSWPTELTVPGCARLPAAAVSSVTVLPTHRRRGILRHMVAAAHAAMRERGESVGLLYASEYPIYHRFGYGSAVEMATWALDARSTGFHTPARGVVELMKPDEDTRDLIRAVHETCRIRQPGEIRRREFIWDHLLGLVDSAWDERWKGFVAVHRSDEGDVDGYVRYRADQKWAERQPRVGLEVDELQALDDDAYDALWRYLAETDWVATIKAEWRRKSERLPWLLTNARAARPVDSGDGLWVRLFDVPRALEVRTYEREARLVLGVVDRETSDGPACYELDAGPDGATCRPTRRSADLTLDVAALGAAYLGGTRLRHAILPGGVDEHRAGALAEADRLFRTTDEPWCSTFF